MGKVPLEVGIQGIALSGNFYGALKSSFLLWPKLAVAKVAEERLTQLFASENREEEIEGNEITLENVSFSYNREILKDASFSMDHRAKILLRGANGAGKSTLLKLLTGLERPEKGKVLLGKVKAGELSRKMFSGKVLYLPQDEMCIRDRLMTILKNVARKQNRTNFPSQSPAKSEVPRS